MDPTDNPGYRSVSNANEVVTQGGVVASSGWFSTFLPSLSSSLSPLGLRAGALAAATAAAPAASASAVAGEAEVDAVLRLAGLLGEESSWGQGQAAAGYGGVSQQGTKALPPMASAGHAA